MMGRPVLIVDDDPILRQIVAEVLADAGYPVVEAYDGLDALHHIEQQRPSLLLTEIHMPRLDGEALAQALRERGYDPPIIVMTGTSRRPEQVVAAIGAQACLLKPVDIDALLDTVERLRIP
jgi:CheY-like chemotaxis protein